MTSAAGAWSSVNSTSVAVASLSQLGRRAFISLPPVSSLVVAVNVVMCPSSTTSAIAVRPAVESSARLRQQQQQQQQQQLVARLGSAAAPHPRATTRHSASSSSLSVMFSSQRTYVFFFAPYLSRITSQWRNNGVGRVGKVQGAPSVRGPRVPSKKK